jgi:hypothetical protein
LDTLNYQKIIRSGQDIVKRLRKKELIGQFEDSAGKCEK